MVDIWHADESALCWNSCVSNLEIHTDCQRIMSKCSVYFRRIEVRPEIVNCCQTLRWCCGCWYKGHAGSNKAIGLVKSHSLVTPVWWKHRLTTGQAGSKEREHIPLFPSLPTEGLQGWHGNSTICHSSRRGKGSWQLASMALGQRGDWWPKPLGAETNWLRKAHQIPSPLMIPQKGSTKVVISNRKWLCLYL